MRPPSEVLTRARAHLAGGWSEPLSLTAAGIICTAEDEGLAKYCVHDALRGVDYIFHAAALKQVPSSEFYPMEAVRTNVLGAENVMRAAVEAVGSLVFWRVAIKPGRPVAMGVIPAGTEAAAFGSSRRRAARR